jgi:hypothetical protein
LLLVDPGNLRSFTNIKEMEIIGGKVMIEVGENV